MALQPGLVGLRKISAGLRRFRQALWVPEMVSRILLYTGRSISCADKTTAQALRSERSPAKSLLLNGGLETSCFQPFSAAGFSRSFVSARLKSLPLCKSKSLGCFSGVSERGVAGWVSRLRLLYPSLPGRWRHGRLPRLTAEVTPAMSARVPKAVLRKGPESVALRTKADGFSGGAVG